MVRCPPLYQSFKQFSLQVDHIGRLNENGTNNEEGHNETDSSFYRGRTLVQSDQVIAGAKVTETMNDSHYVMNGWYPCILCTKCLPSLPQHGPTIDLACLCRALFPSDEWLGIKEDAEGSN